MKYTFIYMNNELNNVDKVTINQCKKLKVNENLCSVSKQVEWNASKKVKARLDCM